MGLLPLAISISCGFFQYQDCFFFFSISPPESVDSDGAEVVEPLSDGVEHDEAQGDPDHGVDHREELPAEGLGRGVAVAWKKEM